MLSEKETITGQPQSLSPTPKQTLAYSIDEVVDNFTALLDQTDFQYELDILDLGSMRFGLRRKMKMEWEALFIGLWRLALERSFPADYAAIFNTYIERRAASMKPGKKRDAFFGKVQGYMNGLVQHGDSDFVPTARYLISLSRPENDAQTLQLRLALHIRNLYTLIFERLI